jgi:hypothetical protein
MPKSEVPQPLEAAVYLLPSSVRKPILGISSDARLAHIAFLHGLYCTAFDIRCGGVFWCCGWIQGVTGAILGASVAGTLIEAHVVE